MFAPFCKVHGTRVLLPVTAITTLVEDAGTITAHFVCDCGTPGVWSSHRV